MSVTESDCVDSIVPSTWTLCFLEGIEPVRDNTFNWFEWSSWLARCEEAPCEEVGSCDDGWSCRSSCSIELRKLVWNDRVLQFGRSIMKEFSVLAVL